MKYAVLGTGTVGRALASKLVSLGHSTWMGSRTADSDAGLAWAADAGALGTLSTFSGAANAADIVLLAVGGQHALAVVEAAADGLQGKVLVDLTNPLDFSQGFPPRLSVCNDDSLGEQIQAAVPGARVVKTLNTLSNTIMVDPGKLSEPSDLLIAGDDAEAKAVVTKMLVEWGHRPPVDLGGIDASRGLEAWLLLWTRLYGALGTGDFNIRIVR